jgi:hypothetical protein
MQEVDVKTFYINLLRQSCVMYLLWHAVCPYDEGSRYSKP